MIKYRQCFDQSNKILDFNTMKELFDHIETVRFQFPIKEYSIFHDFKDISIQYFGYEPISNKEAFAVIINKNPSEPQLLGFIYET